MRFFYLWNKLFKKLPGYAVKNCNFEKPSKIEAQSTAINTSMGRYSYCGYHCTLVNCRIGRFCSIADYVTAGLASHPIDWVSTSPAFYFGRDSIPKDLANLEFSPLSPQTIIGNDVWIGQNVLIKPGVTIGNGAVIGMGSVVTRDVPSYAVVAGNPARIIKTRFDYELSERLEKSCWWELEANILKKYSHCINDPEKFLEMLEEKQ